MPSSNAETAERLNRRRARMLPVLALFVLIQQAAYFGSGDRLRTVDLVRNSAWIVLVAVILAGLLTGGFWFRSREVRELMNDEVTRATGETFTFTAKCRIDTANEMEYYRNGGILHYVLRKLAA